jgi:uncharacterized membrane protein HdeD (DUF308 family)
MQLSVVGRPTKPFTEISVPRSAAVWLRNYYLTRAVVSAAWVAAAFAVGRSNPFIAGFLFIAYPAWDAITNYFDGESNGGLHRNPTQTLNLIVSALTAGAVAIALNFSLYAVLGVFGVWASLAGLLQLSTAIRRWKTNGAQWAMILSGAQSTLAGVFMVKTAFGPHEPDITGIAPYAAFGAFYFLVSAIWLTVSDARHSKTNNPAV